MEATQPHTVVHSGIKKQIFFGIGQTGQRCLLKELTSRKIDLSIFTKRYIWEVFYLNSNV